MVIWITDLSSIQKAQTCLIHYSDYHLYNRKKVWYLHGKFICFAIQITIWIMHFSWSTSTILLFYIWSMVDARWRCRRPFYSPFHHDLLKSSIWQVSLFQGLLFHPLRDPKLIQKKNTSAELLDSINPYIWGVKKGKN